MKKIIIIGACLGVVIYYSPAQSSEISDVASVIAAEACSEGEVGMRAVAATILNRSKSRRISPQEVVKQKNQYYGWTAGNRERLYSQCKGTADKIAKEVLEGTLIDITDGAEYFLLPGEKIRAWHGERTVTIKKHTFYRETKKQN